MNNNAYRRHLKNTLFSFEHRNHTQIGILANSVELQLEKFSETAEASERGRLFTRMPYHCCRPTQAIDDSFDIKEEGTLSINLDFDIYVAASIFKN